MENPLRAPDDPGFRLIETMLWTPDEGVLHVGLHLDRLQRSAARFGIIPDGAADLLAGVQADAPRRLRLTVDRSGQSYLESFPFMPTSPDTVWHVQAASERLTSNDPWLEVKTTQRALYDHARASLADGVDEVIFLNEKDEVCEGTITNVFADLGEGLVTPPLTCGVLPGILRQTLLQSGQAQEKVLCLGDLRDASALYVGNALRGMIRATLG